MSTAPEYDSFTIETMQTALGTRYDYVLHGPRGARYDSRRAGHSGHVCLKQAIYAATRCLTKPLRFDGMADGSEPKHRCEVRRNSEMGDLHVHVHSVPEPKVGRVYGTKKVRQG